MTKGIEGSNRGDWRRWILPGVLLFLAGLVLLAVAWTQREWLLSQLEVWRLAAVEWLRLVPLPFYLLAFIVLPAVGMPLTLFYITVGAVVGEVVPSLLLAWLCVLCNMALCYALTRGVLQPVIASLVHRRGMEIPQIPTRAEWKFIVMLRASPLPWVFQNYILALAGARLVPYLFLSILVQGAIGAGMIIVGGSLFAGNARFALIGIFVFFAVSCGLSLLRRRVDQTKQNEPLPS